MCSEDPSIISSKLRILVLITQTKDHCLIIFGKFYDETVYFSTAQFNLETWLALTVTVVVIVLLKQCIQVNLTDITVCLECKIHIDLKSFW